jgi:hypothetical protein
MTPEQVFVGLALAGLTLILTSSICALAWWLEESANRYNRENKP